MKTYQELKEEFDCKVAWLEKRCKHEEAEWTWLYGIPGGKERVKLCWTCNKVLEREPSSTGSSGSVSIFNHENK